MYKFFLKYCTFYRIIISKFFGISNVYVLHIPFGILCNFDYNYLIYNAEGKVLKGTKYLYQAIKERYKKNFGISVLYETYL